MKGIKIEGIRTVRVRLLFPSEMIFQHEHHNTRRQEQAGEEYVLNLRILVEACTEALMVFNTGRLKSGEWRYLTAKEISSLIMSSMISLITLRKENK